MTWGCVCVCVFVCSGENYKITFPSYYVKGLVLGTLRMEIVGDIAIQCEKSGLELALSFKNKGWIRGTNNSVCALFDDYTLHTLHMHTLVITHTHIHTHCTTQLNTNTRL